TRSYQLADQHRQVMVMAPLFEGMSDAGRVIGFLRLRDLIDAVVKPELARGWSVTVYDGTFLVYGPVWAQSGPEAGWVHDDVAQIDGLSLRAEVWPSEDLEKQMKSFGPALVLALGYLLAVIAAGGVYLMQGEPRRPETANAPAVEDHADGAS